MAPGHSPIAVFRTRPATPSRCTLQAALSCAAAVVWIGGALSCGGSPGGPAPLPPPPNQPPVIAGIAIEPARIELNEEVALRATVQDAETPAESLIYEWSADGGAFTGEGASVTWRPPQDAQTPADVALRLTVRERYGPLNAQGTQAEHVVNATSPPVRVHDSPTELREMSLRFLELFADSDRSPDECLVDFSDSCRGKASERKDIEENRKYYDIRSSSFDFEHLDIADNRMSARMVVDCEFRSRFRRCPSEDAACVIGASREISGVCRLTAIYENQRWWLCDSHFDSDSAGVSLRFFGGR